VLYAWEFRRLASVTQVASGAEGHVFHNRLTHSIKVSQLARRIAEYLRQQDPVSAWPSKYKPIPECAAAAGLAHDLGHPPFGHIAEKELDRCVQAAEEPDGFEGNAQSFRIVTRLCAHRKGYFGLDLMPRTLDALLKYPWQRHERSGDTKKFGVYSTEAEVLAALRPSGPPRSPSLEAQIMDVADDIAYAVHDLEDFWRAGLIPIGALRSSEADFEGFVETWKRDPDGKLDATEIDKNVGAFRSLLLMMPLPLPGGGFKEQASLNNTLSVLIGTFVRAISVDGPPHSPTIKMDPVKRAELRFLQRLTWHYVIQNPRLATQQKGQARVVEELFLYYLDLTKGGRADLVPSRFRHQLDGTPPARLAADIVASFGDSGAATLAGRITGANLGSVLDHPPV